MHVVDLTTLYIDRGSGGGVNTYLAEKARFLARRGIRHTIVVPGERDGTTTWNGARLVKLSSPRVPWNPEHRVLARLREVREILTRAKPSVVEVDCAYLLGNTAERALRGANVPIIGFYHVHLPTFIARPGAARLGRWFANGVEHLTWRYLRRCVRACSRIVVTSPDIEARLGDRGFGDDVVRVPLGVNIDVFHPADGARPDRRRVTYVGRLSPEKDLSVLCDALEHLPDDVQLEFVGDGPVRKTLARRAAAEPRITLRGPVEYASPEHVAAYAEATVFANPSPNEAFGLAALEAAACGTPVVCADRGGPRHVVTDAIGLLAKPGDAADFATKIRAVLDAPDRFRGARDHVLRHATWDVCFERLLDVYAGAMEPSAATHEVNR